MTYTLVSKRINAGFSLDGAVCAQHEHRRKPYVPYGAARRTVLHANSAVQWKPLNYKENY